MQKLFVGAAVAVALAACSKAPSFATASGPADHIVKLQTAEKASFSGLQISPDGRYVVANAALLSPPTLIGFDAWSGAEVWRLEAKGLRARLSPSGRLIVVRSAVANQWQLAIHDAATAEKLLALEGDAVGWDPAELVFSHDDKWLAVRTADMDVALFPLDAARQPGATATAQAIVVRRSTRGYNPIGARYAHLGFSATDDALFVLWPDSHLLERYSVGPQPRLLESLDQTKSMLVPHGLSDDGVYGFSCGFTDLTWGRVDATSGSELERMRIDVEMPTGGYSFNPSSDCDASRDRRWLALGIDEGSGNLQFDYSLGIFTTDGRLVAHDAGAGQGEAGGPLAAHATTLRFAPDSSNLYVADAKLGLHVYKLGDEIKSAYVKPEELGFTGKRARQPHLAAANDAVAVLDFGTDLIVWVPVVGDTVAYEKR